MRGVLHYERKEEDEEDSDRMDHLYEYNHWVMLILPFVLGLFGSLIIRQMLLSNAISKDSMTHDTPICCASVTTSDLGTACLPALGDYLFGIGLNLHD